MQVNSVNNNNTNFKGQIIFKDQCIKMGKSIESLNCLSIPSESIKNVGDVGEPTQRSIEAKLGKLSAKMRKLFTVDLKKYKTVILTPRNEAYAVTADFKKISDAKRKVDGTSKFVEI